MNRFLKLLLICFVFYFMPSDINGQSFIHVDQFGYQIDAEKFAVVSDPQIGYNADESYTPNSSIDLYATSTSSIVATFPLELWSNGNTHGQSGDKGWWIDFSDFKTKGAYYFKDPIDGQTSATFEIGNDVYKDVLKASMKMFYYNRCNSVKSTPYAAAKWVDTDNFRNAGQDANCRYYLEPDNASKEKELTGGWFDAGDYNKYVNYALYAAEDLLAAYETNPETFTDDWNIPESSNGVPDILDEVKYELDWVYKMSNPTGEVHMKMGSISFQENVGSPPSVNVDPRYYGNTCTSASLSTALMFSHAAKVFYNIGETEYGDKLKARAISCFSYVEPFIISENLETDCDDQSINASDSDENFDAQMVTAIAASVYLFEITEDEKYHDFFKSYYEVAEPIASSYWSPYTMHLNDALLLYTTLEDAEDLVSTRILTSAEAALESNVSSFYTLSEEDLYRASVPDWMYHWGSNKAKAHVGNLCNLFMRYNISPEKEEDLAQKSAEMIHYFHGVNPLDMVYLSNMYDYGGDRCANEIYHTWFADGTDYDNALLSSFGPAPGYLAGGPNSSFSMPSISPPGNNPLQKSYLDWNAGYPSNSWEITEPSITYQAAYVRLLSNFVPKPITTSSEEIQNLDLTFEIYPNPVSEQCQVDFSLTNKELVIVQLTDLNGKSILTKEHYGTIGENNIPLEFDEKVKGFYFVNLQLGSQVFTRKIFID